MAYIRVFEHAVLCCGKSGSPLTPGQLTLLQEYHGSKGSPFFTLVHDGVKFCEYVGVLQIGSLTIEVLPKTDASDDKDSWQRFLINMLKATGMMNIHEAGYASLRLKSHSLLELYFLVLLEEVRYLLQTGLVKKYRRDEGNTGALKGRLLFGKHLQQNLVHAERFYTCYPVYDKDHLFNQILAEATALVARIATPAIATVAKGLLFQLPGGMQAKPTQELFDRLVYDRKTEPYRTAIEIAKLLLLNYHPDLRRGQNNVMALMFDMNMLWEKYVCRLLAKNIPGDYYIREQKTKDFWRPYKGRMRSVKADMVVYSGRTNEAIASLDTKWKQLKNGVPADDDLKQMLIYNLYNHTQASALVYPGNHLKGGGRYQLEGHGCCDLLFLPLVETGNNISLDISPLVNFINPSLCLK